MFDERDATAEEARSQRAHALLDRVLSVDPACATGAELADVFVARTELASIVDGAAVGAIPKWEASKDWAADGSRSSISWLVNHTGTARSSASALRRTGLLAGPMPHVSAAAAAGGLPLSHLHQLTRARTPEVEEMFDRQEQLLVDHAKTLTADALGKYLRAWRYLALAELERNDPDREPCADSENSTASVVASFAGRGIVQADLTPEALAIWTEAVEARIETWQRKGMLKGDDRTYAELVADALTDLIADGANSSSRGQPRPLLIAIATLTALLDLAGVPANERDRWRAEILGGGPLSKPKLRELMEKANIQFVVIDDNGLPLHVGRAHRLANAAMLIALMARSGGHCEFPGCNADHRRGHAHHITWWEHNGLTDIENLAFLCPAHHRLVHRGWTLTRGPTGLDFRRPDGTPIPATPFTDAA